MAKVPFSKLQASVNVQTSVASYCNKAGEEIKYEVKRYLPMSEKLELVSDIINQSIDDNGFYNPMRVKVFTVLGVAEAYTNLSFTEKMKEDPLKLYDILTSTGIISNIIAGIDPEEWNGLQEDIYSTIKNIYDYKNSVLGILDTVSTDYKNLSLDATAIQQKLAEGEGVELLQDIMSKLG